MLTGEKNAILKQNPVCVILSTTNLIRTGLGYKLGLRLERPTTNRLSYCIRFIANITKLKIQLAPRSKHTPSRL